MAEAVIQKSANPCALSRTQQTEIAGEACAFKGVAGQADSPQNKRAGNRMRSNEDGFIGDKKAKPLRHREEGDCRGSKAKPNVAGVTLTPLGDVIDVYCNWRSRVRVDQRLEGATDVRPDEGDAKDATGEYTSEGDDNQGDAAEDLQATGG